MCKREQKPKSRVDNAIELIKESNSSEESRDKVIIENSSESSNKILINDQQQL